jgi:general secretion pathway protein C
MERQHNTSIVTTVAQSSRLPGELGNQLLAQAPRWIFILLVLLISVRGALLIADLAGGPVATAARAVLPDIQPLSRKVVDIPSILRANLFGQAPLASGADAPITTMNLKLSLVLADADEKLGFASLGSGPTDIRFYRVGDEVPGGAKLYAVYVDRVLLDRGGTIEALVLPQRPGQVGVVPPPMPMASNPAASVARVQQAVRDNPSLLNQVMQRQPVFTDGRLRGMRVNPGPNAQAFAKLGLRPNDIITAINGLALDDQARSGEVFNTLGSSAEAHVTIDRNGRSQELTLNIAEIANEAERLATGPAPPMPEPAPAPEER